MTGGLVALVPIAPAELASLVPTTEELASLVLTTEELEAMRIDHELTFLPRGSS